MSIAGQLHLYFAMRRPRRRTKLFRFFPGDRCKSYRPRGLRIGRFRIPLPFLF